MHLVFVLECLVFVFENLHLLECLPYFLVVRSGTSAHEFENTHLPFDKPESRVKSPSNVKAERLGLTLSFKGIFKISQAFSTFKGKK